MTKRILLLCVLAIGGLAAFGATPAFAASTAVTQNAWFQNQNRIIEVSNRVRVSWNYNGGTVSNGRCQWTWSKLNFWSLSGRATNCLYEQTTTACTGGRPPRSPAHGSARITHGRP